VVELVKTCGHQPVGFINDIITGPEILGHFEAVVRSHPPENFGIALAIGYNNLEGRWKAWQKVLAAGYTTPALIHPRAYIADSADVGIGSMIMAGAIVDVRAKLGQVSVVWPGACINHDVVIANNCFISPNSTLCGLCRTWRKQFRRAGAAIEDHCTIPPSSFIKMLSRHTKKSI